MSERPIIFNGAMVRAILEGRKTQTRRILTERNTYFNGHPWRHAHDAEGRRVHWADCEWQDAWIDPGPSPAGNPGPYLKVCWPYALDEKLVARVYPLFWPGDLLWVRETWWKGHYDFTPDAIKGDPPERALFYRADGERRVTWRPSIHMPRWASRITLRVTDVRVQRLQDISPPDIEAEGIVIPLHHRGELHDPHRWRLDHFAPLWDSIHGPDAWAANPWVAAIGFERIAP